MTSPLSKEPGNKLRISKSAYKAWLPMFYCIPRVCKNLSIFNATLQQQRPIYLQMPWLPV